jgi:peptidoglycan/LPS O-acetylase OafA/YrhL
VKRPSTRNFVLHRVARIMPGYLAIFLICNYVFRVAYVENPALQPSGTDDGTGMITDPRQLLANLTLVQSYFPHYFQTGLNPSWSLTLEIAFYVSVPLFGIMIFALRKRTDVRPFILASIPPLILLAIGFTGRLLAPLVVAHFHVTKPLLIDWGPNWAAVYLRSFPANADMFAFGMLAAIVIVGMQHGFLTERLSSRVRLYSALALLPALGASIVLHSRRNDFGTTAIALTAGLIIVIIVAPLARGQNSAIAQCLDAAPMRFVGKVSLSAYLWHFPIMLLLGRMGLLAGDSVWGLICNVVVVLVVTLAVSTVTYYLIERPTMNAARRFRFRWA